ncbi:MAG: hypothetical protein M1828_001591 [Chrysothrix sp. TS-e1954]|nr:MAG: hypothetical protein M1828_001591 [Chrysothrix sp. TS-e1954]
MFWRFGGYANISTLDSILDKPDVTLEDLLEESDLIQEVKSNNAKLIEFLRDETRLKKLLDHVIAPKLPEPERSKSPPAAEEKKSVGFFGSRTRSRAQSRDDTESDYEKQDKKRLQYAYYACEILSAEVQSIYDALFERPDYLVEFWEYLKRDVPLEPQQAGYFTKVNEALLDKKTKETIELIKTIDGVVADIMRHVDCPVIMDLLLKLISLEKEQDGQGIVDWLQTQGLIPLLLGCITADHPASTQTSAGDFLKAIITISANATGQDGQVIGPNELTRQLVSESCISGLINQMLKGGNPLTVGVGIIIEVIRKNNSDYDTDAQIAPEPKSSDPIYLGTLLRIFARHINDFMELILSSKTTIMTDTGSSVIERKDLKVAWGDKIEPLGFDRFKTCELMAELLHCSNMGLLNERGSDAAVKARDAERDRLKDEGKLSSLPIPQQQPPQADFGGSLDSSGFQHADAYTPLGESPEDVKKLEVQNNGDDEDFENVAMSEAQPEESQQEAEVSAWNPNSGLASTNLDEDAKVKPSSDDDAIAKDLAALDISKDTKDIPAADLPADSDQMPAPLFSKRQNQQPAPNAQEERSTEDHPQADHPQTDTQSTTTASEQPNDPSQQSTHVIETEEDGAPVVGDFLKINFVENRVVPTILDFFFRFPWNNFLHNVVYDIIQQVFNGSMTRGYNRSLAISLFSPPAPPNRPNSTSTAAPSTTSTPTTPITSAIIAGSARSLASQTSRHPMRLGYMGHLTLIAEEVVKFTERQLPEYLGPTVVESVTDPAWISFVENELTETRERDNAILGGVRPDLSGGRLGSLGVGAGLQSPGVAGSSALADAGLTNNTVVSPGLDSLDLGVASGQMYPAPGGMAGSNLLSGFGSSDEEDDEELEDVELAEGDRPARSSLTAIHRRMSEEGLRASADERSSTDDAQPASEDRDQEVNEEDDRDRANADDEVGELRFDDLELSYQRAAAGRTSTTTTTTTPPTSSTATSTATPAPLTIPPSRARRQLAARLAEKQRLASDPTPSSASISDSAEQGGVVRGLAAVNATAAAVGSPSPGSKRGEGGSKEGTGGGDGDGLDGEGEGNGGGRLDVSSSDDGDDGDDDGDEDQDEDQDEPDASSSSKHKPRPSATHDTSHPAQSSQDDDDADTDDDDDEDEDEEHQQHHRNDSGTESPSLRVRSHAERRPLDSDSDSSSSDDDGDGAGGGGRGDGDGSRDKRE